MPFNLSSIGRNLSSIAKYTITCGVTGLCFGNNFVSTPSDLDWHNQIGIYPPSSTLPYQWNNSFTSSSVSDFSSADHKLRNFIFGGLVCIGIGAFMSVCAVLSTADVEQNSSEDENALEWGDIDENEEQNHALPLTYLGHLDRQYLQNWLNEDDDTLEEKVEPESKSTNSSHFFSPDNSYEKRLKSIFFPLDQIPSHLCCPISGTIMQDPVFLKGEGRTYNRYHIEKWLKKHDKCPISGKKLKPTEKELIPNFGKKNEIEEFVTEQENLHRTPQLKRSVSGKI